MKKCIQWVQDHKIPAAVGAGVILIAIIVACWNAFSFKNEKRVLGVDVSAYQGTVDWQAIADQGMKFAYVKATEGTDYLDSQFKTNWENARKAGLKTGAYLFVDLTEDGKAQADYYIKNVTKESGTLPPVIDFELYGDYADNPPDQAKMHALLKEIIDALKDEYGQTPIIYTNYLTYNTYLTSDFTEVPIWIVDLSDSQPELRGDHQWVFWQYTQRGILHGYDGDEQFIDMDIFNGDLKAFNEMFN